MVSKLLIGKYIEIQVDRNDEQGRLAALTIPYVHHNRIYTKFYTSIRNIDLVLKLFRDGVTLPSPVQQIYDKEVQRRSATAALLEHGAKDDPGWLFKHQQLGRELARVNDRYAFFYDTRTGKTPMSLSIIVDDLKANPNHKWLVLCPLILIENAWLEDAEKFFPELQVVNLHATTKAKRLEAFKKQGQLYISNIESFCSYREHIEKLPIHGCIVDESSTMKSTKSKFGKAAVDYAMKLNRWYLLSGTPAPNGEYEYYRQLQSVDYFGVHQSFNQFKVYFFNNVSTSPQYDRLVIKPERKQELLDLLKKYSIYVDKEDVLTTPGRDFVTVPLELPADLKHHYDLMKNELHVELGDKFVVTKSVATKLNKLNQITSGFIMDSEARKLNKALLANGITEGLAEELYVLSDYRFTALIKLLKQIGNKQVLIWCYYKYEFKKIKELLGDECACVYGDTSAEDKTKHIKAFKAGSIKYLIANPASADKGLTLTNAHYAIYFSLGYSMELWKQSTERIYADISKQSNRCTYYIFIAKGTVDKAIYNAVQNKADLSTEILGHLKGG